MCPEAEGASYRQVVADLGRSICWQAANEEGVGEDIGGKQDRRYEEEQERRRSRDAAGDIEKRHVVGFLFRGVVLSGGEKRSEISLTV